MKRRRCWTYGFNTITIIHDKEIKDDTLTRREVDAL